MTDAAKPPAPDRRRTAAVLASIGIVAGGALYLTGWIQDPDAGDAGTTFTFRVGGGALALVFLLGAALLVQQRFRRVGAAYHAGAIVAGLAALDALLVMARVLPWVRNLTFLLAGLLLASLLVTQLRKGLAPDDTSVFAFFSKNWAPVAFLLFLIIARVAADEPLRAVLPTLVINLFFLLLFLTTLAFLAGRYLRHFGSPLSWETAREHKQRVDVWNDPGMENVRGLLTAYIERGEAFEPYVGLMQHVAQSTETPSTVLDPILRRPPTQLDPGRPASPPSTRVQAALLVALAFALPPAGFFLEENVPSVAYVGLLLGFALLVPIVDDVLRPRSDRGLAPLWAAGAVAGAACAAILFAGAGLFLYIVGGLILLLYGARAATAWLRKPATPPTTAAKVADATTQAARAKKLRWTGIAIGGLAIAYWLTVLATERWFTLPDPGAGLLVGTALAGAALVLASLVNDVLLREHRAGLEALHAQERNQRNAFHLGITNLLGSQPQ